MDMLKMRIHEISPEVAWKPPDRRNNELCLQHVVTVTWYFCSRWQKLHVGRPNFKQTLVPDREASSKPRFEPHTCRLFELTYLMAGTLWTPFLMAVTG